MAGLLRACAALHVVEAGETNLVAGLAHLRINVGRITPLRGRGGPPSPTSFVFFFLPTGAVSPLSMALIAGSNFRSDITLYFALGSTGAGIEVHHQSNHDVILLS